jgi:hypothetical protein
MRISVFLYITAVILSSCKEAKHQQNEPVARAFGSYLYREDLAGIIPADMDEADSSRIARQFIDRWIRNQLYLRLAESNLPDKEKNVEKQIQDFRASLLVHKYQQYLLGQKLDTIISLNEINNYYDSYPTNFVLDRPAISGIYMKIPLSAPDRDRLLSWFRGDNDFVRLENYAMRYAETHLFFSGEWIFINDVLTHLPPAHRGLPARISGADHIIVADSHYQYFIGITGYLPPGDLMPLSLATPKIKSIILNQRKNKFLNELEKKIMTEGMSKNHFQYFQ